MNETNTANEKVAFKKRLRQQCILIIDQRIAAAARAIADAQDAANAEEKSSAGDKYETSRAMSHLQKDMYARQLQANRKELAVLVGIDCTSLYTTVTAGCYIQCKECAFFLAAGLGKLAFEGKTVYLLSPDAPLAKIIFGKAAGQTILFAKTEMVIETVF